VRWKSRGHAQAGFLTLARLAGFTDEEAGRAFARDDRESIIRAVVP
jgi:hypothetical protein